MNDRIKKIRKDAGLNQTDFGASIGATVAMITSYERGKVVPDASKRMLICQKYGYNLRWLETGEGDPRDAESDNEIQLITRAMEGQSERKKQLILKIASLPDELLEQLVRHWEAGK